MAGERIPRSLRRIERLADLDQGILGESSEYVAGGLSGVWQRYVEWAGDHVAMRFG